MSSAVSIGLNADDPLPKEPIFLAAGLETVKGAEDRTAIFPEFPTGGSPVCGGMMIQ
eukprot:m.12807 g.12807  ORF g.12807 m.12807 type:complete len:57 (+) comp4733_c0_seq2:2406-2576(+)